jgi:adenine-specific DNA-methyltransferase
MATLDGAAPDSPPPEGNPPDGGKYSDLTREALIALLERRDRERARIGIHWANDRAERDSAFNDDFVVLRLVPELCDGPIPWVNLVVEGDNFDALRWLRMTMRGRIKCIFVDPPYNTGHQDWVYNDHFHPTRSTTLRGSSSCTDAS